VRAAQRRKPRESNDDRNDGRFSITVYLIPLLVVVADGKPAGDTGETTCSNRYETFDTKAQGNMEMQLEGHINTCMADSQGSGNASVTAMKGSSNTNVPR
jgi:hypothetical protein